MSGSCPRNWCHFVVSVFMKQSTKITETGRRMRSPHGLICSPNCMRYNDLFRQDEK